MKDVTRETNNTAHGPSQFFFNALKRHKILDTSVTHKETLQRDPLSATGLPPPPYTESHSYNRHEQKHTTTLRPLKGTKKAAVLLRTTCSSLTVPSTGLLTYTGNPVPSSCRV